jgi:hypothetical protein
MVGFLVVSNRNRDRGHIDILGYDSMMEIGDMGMYWEMFNQQILGYGWI